MRQLAFVMLEESSQLAEQIADRFYPAGSLGVGSTPANPERPYMMINRVVTLPYREVQETSRCQHTLLQFFVYDEKGGFSRIDTILSILGAVFVPNAIGRESPSGARCMGVRWEGDSQDIANQSLDSLVKFGQYRFTSNR